MLGTEKFEMAPLGLSGARGKQILLKKSNVINLATLSLSIVLNTAYYRIADEAVLWIRIRMNLIDFGWLDPDFRSTYEMRIRIQLGKKDPQKRKEMKF
jgi:hypothetical protein